MRHDQCGPDHALELGAAVARDRGRVDPSTGCDGDERAVGGQGDGYAGADALTDHDELADGERHADMAGGHGDLVADADVGISDKYGDGRCGDPGRDDRAPTDDFGAAADGFAMANPHTDRDRHADGHTYTDDDELADGDRHGDTDAATDADMGALVGVGDTELRPVPDVLAAADADGAGIAAAHAAPVALADAAIIMVTLRVTTACYSCCVWWNHPARRRFV